jgi:hypothetical protein
LDYTTLNTQKPKELSMKVSDIIRAVLDLVDSQEPQVVASVQVAPANTSADDSELLRMRQIAGLIGSGEVEYTNSPEEKYAGIDAVTASGDDVHRAKNPADIRGNSISVYPGIQ